MARRYGARSLAPGWILFGVTLLVQGCAQVPLEEGLPGDVGALGDEGMRIVWVATTADCLDCQNLDFYLRRLQRQGQVHLTLLHVGHTGDRGVAEAFLARHRLEGTVVTISSNRFRSYRPSIPAPSLILLDGGAVRWISSETSTRGSVIEELEDLVGVE